MSVNEFETVTYTKLKHISVFVNNIIYRNYHMHGETELLCVIRGDARINLAGRSIHADAGSIVLLNPHEPHEIVGCGGGTDFLVVQFARHLFGDYFPLMQTSFFTENDLSAVFKDGMRELWKYVYELADCYIRGGDGFELRCLAAAAKILSLLYDSVPKTACSEVEYLDRTKAIARTERLASYIDDNYRFGISLNDIAEKEGLTPTYLSHFFTDRFGISFREYVNNIRFENALRLMPNNKMSIVEIAMHSGFSDVKYLTKMFVERFGCTPKQYRKSHEAAASGVYRSDSSNKSENNYERDRSLRLLEDIWEFKK